LTAVSRGLLGIAEQKNTEMPEFKHNDKVIYSVPRQLGDSNYYTQTISDEENNKQCIAILSRRSNGTFDKVKVAPTLKDIFRILRKM
jgi:predicted thioredoxin/glutaredoxin